MHAVSVCKFKQYFSYRDYVVRDVVYSVIVSLKSHVKHIRNTVCIHSLANSSLVKGFASRCLDELFKRAARNLVYSIGISTS